MAKIRVSLPRASIVLTCMAIVVGLAVLASKQRVRPVVLPGSKPLAKVTPIPRGARGAGGSGGGGAGAEAGGAGRAPTGCGLAKSTPTDETITLPDGRTFHVYGPDSYDETRRYPIVLAYHGYGSSGPGFAKWFKMHEHVGGAAFTVYPDAKGALWDFAGARDLDYTAAILDAMSAAWCVDREQVLALGFSYGGRFVHHLGCKRPDLVRAIVAGGSAWDPETGCAPMPVLVIHRTNDPSMRFAAGKESAERWAKVDGCAAEPEDVDSVHGCVAYRACRAGGVTFCEDTHSDTSWPVSWNHTVREEYRTLAWRWFREVSR